MAATTKKQVVAIMLPSTNITASSCTKNGGTAVTKTGMTTAPSSITTPAALAALFGALGSFLGVASNIETVSNIATSGTNRLIIARLVAMPIADTLAWNLTAGSVYTGAVIDVTAWADPGLASDAELAVMANFTGALAAAMA